MGAQADLSPMTLLKAFKHLFSGLLSLLWSTLKTMAYGVTGPFSIHLSLAIISGKLGRSDKDLFSIWSLNPDWYIIRGPFKSGLGIEMSFHDFPA